MLEMDAVLSPDIEREVLCFYALGHGKILWIVSLDGENVRTPSETRERSTF